MKQTAASMAAWLAAVVAAGKLYDPAGTFVGVATAITDRGEDTTQADVTEALGGAATRLAVTTWSAPYRMTDGRWAVQSPVLRFALTGADVGQTISHWFLNTLVAGGVLKGFAPLPNQVGLLADQAPLAMVVRLTLDPAGRFDATVIWDG